MNKLLETAERWVGEYLPVLPVHFMSKKAMVPWEEFQTRLPSHTELANWFYSSLRNIGLIVGNGLVVIDFDVQEAFDYWLPEFLTQYPGGTYMVKTRRGVHVYVHTEQPAKNYHGPLLDIKAERGYVLIPPSIHPSGYEYQVLLDVPVLQVERLEDVLPEYFMPTPEVSESVAPAQYVVCDDPWEMADSAGEVDSVQEIRARHSILSLLPDAEPSDRSGRWYVANCPFHDDKTPSFWIDTQRGLCGCHTCGMRPMDVINLFARLNQVSNQEAIRELGKR